MEYSKFENKLLNIDCFTTNDDDSIHVFSSIDETEVASINLKRRFNFDIDFDLSSLTDIRINKIIKLVIDFSKTPLEERNIRYDDDGMIIS